MLAKVKVAQQSHADIAFLISLREKKFWVGDLASFAINGLPELCQSLFQFAGVEERDTWLAQGSS